MFKLEYHTYGEFCDCFMFYSEDYRVRLCEEYISIYLENDFLCKIYYKNRQSTDRFFKLSVRYQILNLFIEIEKLETFELIHIGADVTSTDLGSVLFGDFGANKYYEKYNLALCDFYKVKKFVGGILDLYSELYE